MAVAWLTASTRQRQNRSIVWPASTPADVGASATDAFPRPRNAMAPSLGSKPSIASEHALHPRHGSPPRDQLSSSIQASYRGREPNRRIARTAIKVVPASIQSCSSTHMHTRSRHHRITNSPSQEQRLKNANRMLRQEADESVRPAVLGGGGQKAGEKEAGRHPGLGSH